MTNNKYNKYQGLSITKELLDSIEIGDLIKINDWGKPLRVKCVSKNYVALAIKLFNKNIYSIIEKKIRIQGNHNEMQKGKFHVGPDNMIFGDLNFDYLFNNNESMKGYLERFECNLLLISERTGMAINCIEIKKNKKELTK